jgi:outer membrane protein TolC
MKRKTLWALALALPCYAGAQMLPPDATQALGLAARQDVPAVLQQSLAYGAAQQQVLAEQALRTQASSGAGEWALTLGAARPRIKDAPGSAGTDTELTLERPLRWPGKRGVQMAHADARVAWSQAQARRAWVDNARQLLNDLGAWLRESHQSRILGAQLELLRQQLDVVARRQRLGDAAALETVQAEAALAQLRGQALAAAAREQSARRYVLARHPGLALQDTAPDVRPTAPEGAAAAAQGLTLQNSALQDQLLSSSAELQLARQEAAAAQALAAVDSAERRADPSVALKWTRTRQGAEQSVGVFLTLPFGGDYRAAAADASAARARAAAQLEQDQLLRVRSESQRRLSDLEALRTQHGHSAQALQQLQQVAQRISRGYVLGEGHLTEVLLAQRQVLDQELATAQLGVDFSLAQAQVLVDAGLLWPGPTPAVASR